jgi:hypothetical protein
MPPGVSLLDFALDSKVKTVAQAEVQQAAFQKKAAARTPAGKKAAAEAAQEPKAQPKSLDVTIKVSGVADSDVQVAQFINRLGRSVVFRDVNLIISDEYGVRDRDDRNSDAPRLRKFVIEMALDPAAAIQPAEAKVVSTAVELKN